MPTAGVTIFGVLNLTRDSFSDGGRWLDAGAAIDHALAMAAEGADAIDVGAASSHPEAEEVPAGEEVRRLAPVVEALVSRGLAVSVDTWRPEVQRFALDAGAAWINDIRGFPDPSMRAALASSTARLVVMHSVSRGTRATRDDTDAASVWEGLLAFFDERVAALGDAGIARERLALDPGMGLFLGAGPEPSVQVLRRLGELKARYGTDLLVGVSRKSFVAALVASACGAGAPPVQRREAASLAAELFAVERGATMVRTHEPRLLRDALAVLSSLRG